MSAEDAAHWGLTLQEAQGPPVGVWPDNWLAVTLFSDDLATQWRYGASGPYGLDYQVLFRLTDRLGLSRPDQDELEADIRLMEHAALRQMYAT